MFSGLYFSYAGELSKDYGIMILDFEGVGKFNTNIFSASVATTKPAQSKRFYCVGSKVEEPPQFPLTVVSPVALDDGRRRAILGWLLNRGDFKQLRVYQPDLQDYYYRCIFKTADAIYINGKCYGFSLGGILDSPYQYGSPAVKEVTTTEQSQVVLVSNYSDMPDGCVYPKIFIHKPVTSSSATIAISEYGRSRTMQLGTFGVAAVDLTIDCRLKTVTSSLGAYSMSNFSGQWTRLEAGTNTLQYHVPIGSTVRIECPTLALVGF